MCSYHVQRCEERHPKITGHPGDFAIARNDLDNAWQSLRKMYEKEDDPVVCLYIVVSSTASPLGSHEIKKPQ
jgi:hypothetical protein